MADSETTPDTQQRTLVTPALQGEIPRSAMTITQYLQKNGLEGGVQVGASGTGASTSASNLLVDEKGHRYDIGGRIAAGGMGAILKARDLNCRRAVAMKVMLPGRDALPGLDVRFIEEAQITAQLEHPNIVPVHELGVDANSHVFYTMKLVHGVTLKAILEQIATGRDSTLRKYPLNQLLTIFLKTCDAVAFAHSKKVIHRDLKPENLMIGEFGEVLVMDWGLAKVIRPAATTTAAPPDGEEPVHTPTGTAVVAVYATEPTEEKVETLRAEFAGGSGLQTHEGKAMGTPSYMPPEQAMGHISELDERADIYTLGGILYTILTLRPPVEGKDPNEVLRKVVQGQVMPPGEHALAMASKAGPGAHALPHLPGGLVPPALAAVVMKALAPRPQDRYASVQELQREIEAYQQGFATAAEHAGIGTQLWLLIKRHKAVSVVMAGAVILLAAGAVLDYKRVARERNEALLAQEQARNERAAALTAKDELARVSRSVAPGFVNEAKAHIDHRLWDKALEAAAIATQLDDRSFPAHLLLGQLQLATHSYDEARRTLDGACRLARPGSSEAARADAARRLAGEMRDLAVKGGAQDAAQVALALAKAFASQSEPQLAAKLYAEAGTKTGAGLGNLDDLKLVAAMDRLLQLNPRLTKGDLTSGFTESGGRYLRCHAQALVDLTPLDGVKIENLDLSRSGVPPAALNNLQSVPVTSLNLTGTAIHDLSVLRGLKLNGLWLGDTGISDLAPLAGMPLTVLDLSNTQVINLAPLNGLPLVRLNLDKTQVTSLAPLTGMKLQELSANYTQLADLAPLKAMPLKNLSLVFASDIRDLAALQGMPLTVLDLTGTQVSDLRPLQGLTLKELSLWNTPVAELAPLKGLPLTKLNLEATRVTELAALRGATALTRLNLGAAPVASVAALRGLSLTALDLRGTKVTDLSPLQGLPLRELGLAFAPVTEFGVLQSLPLVILDLRGTRIADLAAIKGKPITDLGLAFTAVTDLTPLTGMPLTKLDLRGTRVTDLRPLKGAPLTELCLVECALLNDIGVTHELKTLTRLGVPGTCRNIEFLRSRPGLTILASSWDDYSKGLPAAEFWKKYAAANR